MVKGEGLEKGVGGGAAPCVECGGGEETGLRPADGCFYGFEGCVSEFGELLTDDRLGAFGVGGRHFVSVEREGDGSGWSGWSDWLYGQGETIGGFGEGEADG